MKVNIIHFDPVIGGETTLCNALATILKNKYETRIIHPVHVGKKGKLKIDPKWGHVQGEEYLTYEDTAKACKDVEFIFCINAKHVKGSVKSDKREAAQADSDLFFGQFFGKNFIFYEHGFHTWRLYNYENLFSELIKRDNSIRVLTNTKMGIEMYAKHHYNAHLCRQPFDMEQYKPITKNTDSCVKICFNSRYSSTKGPHLILEKFMPFFDKGLNFALQFRGNISDPVSVWHNIDGVLLKDVVKRHSEIVFKDFAADISEVYNQQDYCVYAGYITQQERGKIEYATLEPNWYGIPLIVHPDVFKYFKYEEYGLTEEFLRKSWIELNDENLTKIINKEFNFSSYVENARKIVEDFLPNKILERFDHCLASPASKGIRKIELF